MSTQVPFVPFCYVESNSTSLQLNRKWLVPLNKEVDTTLPKVMEFCSKQDPLFLQWTESLYQEFPHPLMHAYLDVQFKNPAEVKIDTFASWMTHLEAAIRIQKKTFHSQWIDSLRKTFDASWPDVSHWVKPIVSHPDAVELLSSLPERFLFGFAMAESKDATATSIFGKPCAYSILPKVLASNHKNVLTLSLNWCSFDKNNDYYAGEDTQYRLTSQEDGPWIESFSSEKVDASEWLEKQRKLLMIQKTLNVAAIEKLYAQSCAIGVDTVELLNCVLTPALKNNQSCQLLCTLSLKKPWPEIAQSVLILKELGYETELPLYLSNAMNSAPIIMDDSLKEFNF